MPVPAAPKAPSLFAKYSVHAWWVLLLAALALLWLATARRIARVEAMTNTPTWSVDAPLRDATSATGFEQGQRRLIVPGHHNPSYWWIMEAQLAVEKGSLRLRHIDYDARPNGREIHRTSPYRWWLIATGWLYGTVEGEPLGYAIERGALIADPLLLALMLVIGAAYCARYLGTGAAAAFVVGGISLFPLAANFQPGAPDPHSLAWVCALGSVLPLLASLHKTSGRRRNQFFLAGVFSGLGFWNDATSQAPLLLAVFLGALGYEFIRSRGVKSPPMVPSEWRAWALAGGLVVLATSLFEFAPGHFTWSLDFVHPLHAMIAWGMGEVLHAVGIWCREKRQGFNRRSLVLLGLAVLAIAAWPIAGIKSGSGALLATDFYARELLNQAGGIIAPNLGEWLQRPDGDGAKWATLLPAVVVILLLGRVFLAGTKSEERGRLVFVSLGAVFVGVLACLQLRWWNLFDVLLLAALATLWTEAESGKTRAAGMGWGALLLVLPGLFAGFPPAIRNNEVKDLSPLEAHALVERDFSYWLVKRRGAEPTVPFSTLIFSGAAAYYGGLNVIASSDGENKSGFLTAVRVASATTAQETLILLQSLGITHVVLPSWDPTMDRLVRIGLNLPPDQPLWKNAFPVVLQDWALPLWIRPMDYLIPNEPRFQGLELKVFTLQDEQEPDLDLSRLADFFLDRGQIKEAQAARSSLKEYPRSVAALGAIASIDLALGDRARVAESLDALIPQLSRRWGKNLPVDRRISLAALFVRTNHADLAREQLTACFTALDARTLRTLSPGSAVNLVALSRSLAIPFPDPGLEKTALELIPPSVRARFTAAKK